MSMTVEYIQERRGRQTKSTSFRYRRKVPQELRAVLGKGELVIPLGKTKGEALRKYGDVHKEAERVLAAAWDEVRGVVRTTKGRRASTARELYEQALDRVRELGLNPYRTGSDPDDPEDEADLVVRDVLAEQIAAKYRTDPETGYPIGVSPEDTALMRALYSASATRGAPPVTLEDAKKLYLKDRFRKTSPSPLQQKKDEQRAERVIGHVRAALGGRDPAIAELKRADARAVLDHMLRAINNPATVDRYLNDVRAIINHAVTEFDELRGMESPFKKLAATTETEAARQKRKPFSAEQLRATRTHILGRAARDLQLIWRLLEGTGCRLSEVAGLRTVDVVTGGDMPYLAVEWHEERRVKTEPSRRKVPLVGDALEAAKEAVAAAGGARMLFPRYGREGGGTAASKALLIYVRAVVDDRKVSTHSLRHNMKDRLRKARVPKVEQDLILGHTMGGVGESYGGDEALLEVATSAMRKAFDL